VHNSLRSETTALRRLPTSIFLSGAGSPHLYTGAQEAIKNKNSRGAINFIAFIVNMFNIDGEVKRFLSAGMTLYCFLSII
jgi:hypothetical protein